MNVITTWMYSSGEDENILHAQVGSKSSSIKIQNYYWRCVFLLFESSFRLNKDVRHILFINKMPPESIDGISTKELIKEFNIEIQYFETLTKSPPDYYGGWNTQFIVMDVLDWLKTNVNDDDAIFILDSDIIFNLPISDELLLDLKQNNALLYSLDYDLEHKINGLNRKELLEISRELNPSFPQNEFVYSGGEFVCCLGRELENISNACRKVYEICLARHVENKSKFNEEAHLLSYVYHQFNYRTHTGNKYIKRIWTNKSVYSNISGDEDSLIFWHLPAEKKNGFLKAFKSIRKVGDVYKINIKNVKLNYRLEDNFFSLLNTNFMKLVRFLLGK